MRPALILGLLLALALDTQASPGLEKLNSTQRAALEKQIDAEISLARSGNVTAFSTPFTARRTYAQRAGAGLDQLTPSELAVIDAHIAHTLSQRPAYSYRRTKLSADAIETETAKAKISGEVSFTYGTDGHGRNFYGGSFTSIWESPSRNLAIALTVARYKGDGLFLDPCHYDSPFSLHH